jgi:hypothetical protein
MDELVFTNLQMAKGNFLFKNARGARLLVRNASHIDRHQCINRQGMTAGAEIFLSGGCFRVSNGGILRAGTDA